MTVVIVREKKWVQVNKYKFYQIREIKSGLKLLVFLHHIVNTDLTCKFCTFINERGSTICNACGRSLGLPSVNLNPSGIACLQCTFQNPYGSVNCALCGYVIVKVETANVPMVLRLIEIFYKVCFQIYNFQLFRKLYNCVKFAFLTWPSTPSLRCQAAHISFVQVVLGSILQLRFVVARSFWMNTTETQNNSHPLDHTIFHIFFFWRSWNVASTTFAVLSMYASALMNYRTSRISLKTWNWSCKPFWTTTPGKSLQVRSGYWILWISLDSYDAPW